MSSPPITPKRELSASEEPVKKRRRGATRLSCAECRRLKLRCDRGIPCGSCVKRGCGAICPDGSLTTGQGNRFVLASTQELHEKITELCSRVRELEDGLRAAHAENSSGEHPLLSDELLRIKAPLQREAPPRNPTIDNEQEEAANPDVVDSFGTLSINRTGHTHYYGQFANSWYFLQNEDSEEDSQEDRMQQELKGLLPAEILDVSGALPLSPVNAPSIESLGDRLRNLHWYLPSAAKAIELRDIYYAYAAWMYTPIPLADFDKNVYSTLYNTSFISENEILAPVSHRLALMFMVLSIGSLMDARLPIYNVEAEKYHQLARAALFQTSIFDEPTLAAVQVLFLMSYYLFLADRHGAKSGSRWAIMGLTVKLAQTIGLHRDSSRWKVDAPEAQRRRELFWELYVYDSWQCLSFGRPPSFTMAQVDCKMPHNQEPTVEETFNAWKHRFSSECMAVVHDQAFGAKTPTYATILQLDRKLRAITVPPALQIAGFGNSSTDGRAGTYPESVPLILQRHIVLAIREMNLLYMHRSFFARALGDHPKDPLGSPYGSSVIAAYRSAGSLIALVRNLHSQLKEASERMWFLWAHMFSCAIILGSIVTRCPSLSLAPSALVQLDSACELFAKAARGFRAEKVLSIMTSLREKAHTSLQNFRDGKGLGGRYGADSEPMDEEDELTTLGGKTRLIAKRPTTSQPPTPIIDRSPTTNNPVVPFPLKNLENENVHPSVLEYLRTFATPAPTRDTINRSNNNTHPSSQSSFAPAPGPLSSVAPQHDSTLFGFPMDGTAAYPSPAASTCQNSIPSVPQTPNTSFSLNAVDMNFPSYFPVFDYGQNAERNLNIDTSGNTGLGSTAMFSPMQIDGMVFGGATQEANNMKPTHERSMSGTWQDFVAQLSMS
ncbi:fungal-specific transcription factor domain-containing protein [Amylostereum chailletii]|nr:fungal-specific transcription factor domain-containing protein [Amylostereum chailletii]